MPIYYTSRKEREQIDNQHRLTEIKKTIADCQLLLESYVANKNLFDNYEYIVLTTFARSVLCLKEVLTLIQNGFPDGAFSRARTLFEQFIIIAFISEQYQQFDNAEILRRYLDSANLENLSLKIKHNKEFIEMYKSEGKQIDDEAYIINSELKKQRTDIRTKYQLSGCEQNYWWADSVFSKAKCTQKPQYPKYISQETTPKDTSLNMIIDYVLRTKNKAHKMHYLKLLYDRACISTHAGALGNILLLGRDNPKLEKLFTEPTIHGMRVPLLFASISFFSVYEIVYKSLDFSTTNEFKEKYDDITSRLSPFADFHPADLQKIICL